MTSRFLGSSCWLWCKGTNRNGYGRIQKSGKTLMVHRLVWAAFFGEIPPKAVLDHLCRNRRCCNPAHLELTTVRANTLRGEGPTAKRYRACKRAY